ncbi:MAG TPA: hypothetical protein PLN38_17580 [Chitinophagales bacterium]|jgi:hypothetical protein|nr:hypothetical protein [Chitinophagales bacterium]
MKTTKEYLTANRQVIISELIKAFKFESIELKDLMTSFVQYLNENDYDLSEMFIDSVVNEMYFEYQSNNFKIDACSTNNVSMDNHSEMLRQRNINTNNLHN